MRPKYVGDGTAYDPHEQSDGSYGKTGRIPGREQAEGRA